MDLCDICQTIPLRKILEGDGALLPNVKEGRYEARFHDTISELVSCAELCALCNVLAEALQSSFWYGNMREEGDEKKRVWLRIPVGSWSPAIWMYLGGDGPDSKIWGKDIKILADISES